MLTNVIDKKANDPAHNVPFSVWKTGSGRPKPAADYLLKREIKLRCDPLGKLRSNLAQYGGEHKAMTAEAGDE